MNPGRFNLMRFLGDMQEVPCPLAVGGCLVFKRGGMKGCRQGSTGQDIATFGAT